MGPTRPTPRPGLMGHNHFTTKKSTYTKNTHPHPADPPKKIKKQPLDIHNKYTQNTRMKQEPTLQGKRRRNFYLPDALMAEVELIALNRETSTTDIIRRALEAYVRAWKAKNVN